MARQPTQYPSAYLHPFTGPTAAGFTTVATGFDTRIDLQNAEGGVDGRTIKVVDGDDQGTSAGALSAAQTLVEQKQAFAIGSVGIEAYGAEPYLTGAGVPVAGGAIDGPEWAPPNNSMFPVLGSANPQFPAPVFFGSFFKQ
jgi:branched-chain amino acid transport system substrate-binding protein